MAFLSDACTDTNGVAITAHVPGTGGTWTLHPSSIGGASIIIQTNRLMSNHAADNIFYNTAAPSSADYDVEADMVFFTALAGTLSGVFGRGSTSVKTNYFFGYQASDTKWHLFKNVAGVFTDLGSSGAVTLTGSQSYHIKLQMRGTTIVGFVDGVSTVSVTDSAVTAAGVSGVWMQGAMGAATGQHLDNITSTDGALAASPSTVELGSSGNVVTLTGVGTAWTPGSPGAPTFTLSGGTGASITAQTVASTTSATVTITAGSTTGALTVTDPSTGGTVTVTVVKTILVNDANLGLSPGNWNPNGATNIKSSCAGAYVKFRFTGTTQLTLVLDISMLVSGAVATANYPKLVYSINSGVLTTIQPTATTISLVTGLTTGTTYTIEMWIKATKQTEDRWTTPNEVVCITGFRGDTALATASLTGTVAARSKRALFYGDSITEGVESLGTNSGDLTSNDAYQTWVRWAGIALDCEYGQIGYGFQGYVHAANGNVPKLVTSYASHSNGVARTMTGFDYVFVNMGTNDTAANSALLAQSDVTGFLTALRTAIGGTAKIFVIVPFSQINQATIAAAVTTAQASDSKVYLIDLGTVFQAGLDNTSSGAATENSADGLHPNQPAGAKLGAAVAQKVQIALTPYATQGGGGGTRIGLGL